MTTYLLHTCTLESAEVSALNVRTRREGLDVSFVAATAEETQIAFSASRKGDKAASKAALELFMELKRRGWKE